jgi:hypothetical protein
MRQYVSIAYRAASRRSITGLAHLLAMDVFRRTPLGQSRLTKRSADRAASPQSRSLAHIGLTIPEAFLLRGDEVIM